MQKVPPLPEEEQKLWVLDQKINQRGIPVDTDACQHIVNLCAQYKKNANKQLEAITGGALTSIDQSVAMATYCGLPDVAKATVASELEKGPNPVLELRQSAAKASVAKFTKLQAMSMEDSRIRGTLRYYRAGTGRWGGTGFQPQNLPSRGIPKGQTLKIFQTLLDDPDWAQSMYGDVMHIASWCVRPCVRAPEGKTFYQFDYSSIEGRILAWLAEDPMLEVYADPTKDVYTITAQSIGPDTPRDDGKVLELACGYQGSVGACKRMAEGTGVEKTDEEWLGLVRAWRDNRKPTVAFWYNIQSACIQAIRSPGVVQTVNRQRIRFANGVLAIKLLSGRCLFYRAPRIVDGGLTFMATRKAQDSNKDILETDPLCPRWVRKKTYGGRLVENIVQATARDFLVYSMFRLEASGYKTIFHVHDEVVIEDVPDADEGDMQRLLELVPDWAEGFPLAVDGWTGDRYKK